MSDKEKINVEKKSTLKQRKAQRTLVFAFLSAVVWAFLAIAFFSLENESFWQTEFSIFFSEDGNFLYSRLLALVAGLLALISFLIAYAAMLGDLKSSSLSSAMHKLPVVLADVALASVQTAIGLKDTIAEDKPNVAEEETTIDDVYPLINSTENWFDPIISAKIRLKEEEFRLNQSSFTNLLWGIIVSTAALAALIWTILTSDTTETPETFVELFYDYGPRLTLVLISQILAAFFLKLHVSSQNELTKIRNEITNLDLRLTAGLLIGNSAVNKQKLAEKLISEERNFILKKNEKVSIDNNLTASSSLVKEIKSLIESLKP